MNDRLQGSEITKIDPTAEMLKELLGTNPKTLSLEIPRIITDSINKKQE